MNNEKETEYYKKWKEKYPEKYPEKMNFDDVIHITKKDLGGATCLLTQADWDYIFKKEAEEKQYQDKLNSQPVLKKSKRRGDPCRTCGQTPLGDSYPTHCWAYDQCGFCHYFGWRKSITRYKDVFEFKSGMKIK